MQSCFQGINLVSCCALDQINSTENILARSLTITNRYICVYHLQKLSCGKERSLFIEISTEANKKIIVNFKTFSSGYSDSFPLLDFLFPSFWPFTQTEC